MNRTFVWASAALLAVASLSGAAQAQVVVSTPVVATPQVVGVVPVRRGLFGLRTSYRPVYGTAVTPVQTSFYMPSSSVGPVQTSYYAPTTTVAPIQTSYYAPAATAAPIQTSFYAPTTTVAPIQTSFYAPTTVAPVQTTYYGATAAPQPVTTTRFSSEYSGSISSSHYVPAPTVTTNYLPTTTYYGGTSVTTPTITNYAPTSTFYGPVTTPTTTYYAPMEAIVVP